MHILSNEVSCFAPGMNITCDNYIIKIKPDYTMKSTQTILDLICDADPYT